MFKRMSLAVVLVLLIGSVLTACGGSAPAPVTFNQLPVFSGATESTNTALVAAAAAIADAMKADVKSIESKAYDVPADATWAAIKSFYSTALEKDGWTASQSGTDTQSWSRGTQGIVLKFTGSGGLIVALFEVK